MRAMWTRLISLAITFFPAVHGFSALNRIRGTVIKPFKANKISLELSVQKTEPAVELPVMEKPVKWNGADSDYLRRRNVLQRSGVYSKVEDQKTLEGLVFSMEELSVPCNMTVFTQNDKADAMYFVKSGKFECYDESTGEVIAVVGNNQVFGELGVLLHRPRALSVRAATPDAKVYKLAKADIEKYVLGEENTKATARLKQAGIYTEYFENNSKRDALKACPIFKELGNEDIKRLVASMKRMEISAGERIIEEGARGGSMYFVCDGCFACYRESNQKVVKVCKEGDYFGELGVLFDRPRAVSVRATDPSVVWELHGDAFLDSYRKMTAAKFGAASWILLLGKVIRADKWIRHVVPEPVRNFSRKLQFLAGDFVNRINLLDSHFEEDRWRGTRTHINNSVISLAILCFFWARRASAGSVLSATVMSLCSLGILVDNLINASGKYIGEGERLRLLTKIRLVSHGMTIPLLFIPVIEAGMLSGLFPKRAAMLAMGAAAAYSVTDAADWLHYDTNDLAAVDNRDSTTHSVKAIAGTLSYSSGKVLKCVLPVVIQNLFMLVVGSVLMKGGVPAGKWFVAASLAANISCSLQWPDIQVYGEPTMTGLMWAAAASSVF